MKDRIDPEKFSDPYVTATGEERAVVALTAPKTLWFNTGTLCNIECANCYIESSPSNDRLVYLTADEMETYLDELSERRWGVTETGFTGGEPFMNPEMVEMAERALDRGYEVLILTNAMRPMMRKSVRARLEPLIDAAGERLTFRVSLDHYDAERHDAERGAGAYEKTLEGMRWLSGRGARLAIAGRALWHESDSAARDGYRRLFEREGFDIDADDPGQTVLFPEMDETAEVPEITTACWDILGKSPAEVMCASSRMVVKRKGAARPTVLACTLLPYDSEFDLGPRLADAERPVRLNHPHCAKFCVLGGASCSA